MYFWRTGQQQEVDFVEEKENTITGYEFKWNAKKMNDYLKPLLKHIMQMQKLLI